MSAESLAILAVIGVIAGWLASLVVGGGGLLRYLISGVIGSFVGGFIANTFNISIGLGHPLLEQIVIATGGAILVVLLARMLK